VSICASVAVGPGNQPTQQMSGGQAKHTQVWHRNLERDGRGAKRG